MNPIIPLSPQQKKKRRENLLFFSACAGATLLILGYLFYPAGDAANKEPAEPPAQTAEAEAAEPAGPAAPAAEQAGERPAPIVYSDPFSPVSDFPGDAPSSGNEEQEDEQLSEEELAKLPAWEADFMRLSKDNRIAFAVSFARAKRAYNLQQWASCLAHLTDCELIYSGSPNIWNLRACALLECSELDEAEQNINRSLELNPDDNVALMCQAELLMLRRDFRGCFPLLERLRRAHSGENDRVLHDTFTFHQLLCHLMLGQEMEARALVSELTPLSDSPLYYFSQAAFCVYQGDSNGALEPLRSASNIYGNSGETASYRKWMNKCGLADKYVRRIQR